jgi:hypothetical protein
MATLRASRSLRVRSDEARLVERLLADPSPGLQAAMGIARYERLSPEAWRFEQGGQAVTVRVTEHRPGRVAFVLDRGGAPQQQWFDFAPRWLGGTKVTLTLEVEEDAPREKVQGYLDRTLRLLRDLAEGRGPAVG